MPDLRDRIAGRAVVATNQMRAEIDQARKERDQALFLYKRSYSSKNETKR